MPRIERRICTNNMAVVKPFKAVRPHEALADRVASLPYDVYSRTEAADFVVNRPYAFLNIDRPETQFPPTHDMYADDVYQKANEMLQEWIEKDIFVREENPCFYIYELTMDGRSQTGLVALSSVDDYLNNICRKHENTMKKKEQDRIRHVDVCSAQTGPIFLAYRHREDINQIINAVKAEKPLYDFTAEDGITHRAWIVEDTETLSELFEKVPYTYIADGHHRAASAVQVALKRREAHPDYDGSEEFNYFLSVLFPDNELKIIDYNRFVKDLNGLTEEEFLKKLETVFTITKASKRYPEHKGQMMMYLPSGWYQLDVKDEVKTRRNSGPVESLDVALLQDEVLMPILNIQDPRTDQRIEFMGGIRGLDELEKRVHGQNHAAVSFGMYPTDIQELFAVADAGLLMPPKSTWFEPKIRSGLFIHEIER